MRRHNHLLTACSMLFILCASFAGCKQETLYRTPTGLVYRVVETSKADSVATMGSTVKLHYIQKAGDSVMENNFDKMPMYWMVMPGYTNRYNPLEVFDYGIREGDSLVISQRIDSMVKKRILDSVPPYLKATDEWTTYMRVEKIFHDQTKLVEDKMIEQRRADSLQKIAGEERIKKYLKEHNINAVRSDSGEYVQIIQQGNGPQVDTGKTVGVKYIFTNQTSGRLFDTNTDKAFRHPDTLHFVVGTGYMIPSIDRALRSLKQGAHAKVFIPTMLAFGGRPPKGNLRAYDDLAFEVWVLDVR